MPLRSDSGRRHRRSSAEFYPCQSRYQRLRLSSSVSLAFILHVSLLQNCSKGPPAMAVDDFRGLFAGDMGSSTGLFPFGDIYYQMQSLWCYLDSTSQWVHAAVSFHRVSSIASGLTCLWQGVHPSSAGHLLDDAKCSNQKFLAITRALEQLVSRSGLCSPYAVRSLESQSSLNHATVFILIGLFSLLLPPPPSRLCLTFPLHTHSRPFGQLIKHTAGFVHFLLPPALRSHYLRRTVRSWGPVHLFHSFSPTRLLPHSHLQHGVLSRHFRLL